MTAASDLKGTSPAVRTLYAQVLARHCQTDGHVDAREIADLCVFMAQIDLDAKARMAVRTMLREADLTLADLLCRLIAQTEPPDREVIRFSVLKDLVRVSNADGTLSDSEMTALMQAAVLLYETLDRSANALSLAQKIVEKDAALLRGELTGGLVIEQAKLLARTAAMLGVPLAALYFSGSIIGLSAAGIVGGLAALGGLLGGLVVGPMVGGILVLVTLGSVAGGATDWLVNLPRMSAEKVRERIRLALAAANQKAIADLAEDAAWLEGEIVRLEGKLRGNEAQAVSLRRDLQALRAAFTALSVRESSHAA